MTDSPAPSLTAERLIDAFKAQLDEWDLWDTNPTEAFERMAERFYQETGLLARGKSIPVEMWTADYEARRDFEYEKWHKAERAKRHQMLRQVADLLADATARAPKDYPHRCSGCGLRWMTTEPGSVAAELCGDCWRKVQAILHGTDADATALREAAGERDAIATLLSDRSEGGTYAKVEGVLADAAARPRPELERAALVFFHQRVTEIRLCARALREVLENVEAFLRQTEWNDRSSEEDAGDSPRADSRAPPRPRAPRRAWVALFRPSRGTVCRPRTW